MHTFFINTSDIIREKLKNNIYQDILFEELFTDQSLIIPEYYVSPDPDSLKACAEKIARRVDQEADINEDISLIVYMEISCLPKGMPKHFQGPYVIAYEMIRSMIMEQALVWTLCRLGKRPKRLTFIFGEEILRDPTMIDFDIFEKDITKFLWEILCLPSCKETADHFKNNAAFSETTVREYFTAHFQKNPQKNTTEVTAADFLDGEIFSDLISEIARRGNLLKSNIKAEDMYSCLDAAIDEFMRSRLRDMIHGLYPGSVKYCYMPLEFKDVHEIDRSVCRLMLYLYASAYNPNSPEKYRIPLPEEGGTVRTASCIPAVNYTVFKQALYTHAAYCSVSRYTPARPPAELKKTIESQSEFILSEHEPPELLPPNLFRELKENGVDLEDPKRDKIGMISLSALRNAVNKILSIASEKNKTNQTEVTLYLNRISAEYDRIKDDAMKHLPINKKLTEIMEAGGDDAEKRIDDLKNIENEADKLLTDRQLQLLEEPLEMPPENNVEILIDNVRKQTDYYFEALEWRLLLVTAGIGFVLCILIPYFFVRRDIFSLPDGSLFFLGTGAAAVIALVIGRIIFITEYKNKIIAAMAKFLSDFKRSQNGYALLLEQFRNFLYRDIPLYYSFCRYKTYLTDYKEQTMERREKITCHDKSRADRIEMIKTLLDDVDKGSSRELYDEINTIIKKIPVIEIDPETDRIANREVYILTSKDIRDALTDPENIPETECEGEQADESI